jgi:hypothetical protein
VIEVLLLLKFGISIDAFRFGSASGSALIFLYFLTSVCTYLFRDPGPVPAFLTFLSLTALVVGTLRVEVLLVGIIVLLVG